jgi:hypothetical protein
MASLGWKGLITAVTYGEIHKIFYFFKIKNVPTGKLKTLKHEHFVSNDVFYN